MSLGLLFVCLGLWMIWARQGLADVSNSMSPVARVMPFLRYTPTAVKIGGVGLVMVGVLLLLGFGR